jgi:hypothetical protein
LVIIAAALLPAQVPRLQADRRAYQIGAQLISSFPVSARAADNQIPRQAKRNPPCNVPCNTQGLVDFAN